MSEYGLSRSLEGYELEVDPTLEPLPGCRFFAGSSLVHALGEGSPGDRRDFPAGIGFRLSHPDLVKTGEGIRVDATYMTGLRLLHGLVEGPLCDLLWTAAEQGEDEALGYLADRLLDLSRGQRNLLVTRMGQAATGPGAARLLAKIRQVGVG